MVFIISWHDGARLTNFLFGCFKTDKVCWRPWVESDNEWLNLLSHEHFSTISSCLFPKSYNLPSVADTVMSKEFERGLNWSLGATIISLGFSI